MNANRPEGIARSVAVDPMAAYLQQVAHTDEMRRKYHSIIHRLDQAVDGMRRTYGEAVERAFREGFQAGSPDETWDQEWEDGEWKISESQAALESKREPQ